MSNEEGEAVTAMEAEAHEPDGREAVTRSDFETAWLQANNDFLSAALGWLRALLQQRLKELKPALEKKRFFSMTSTPRDEVGEVKKARQAMERAAAIDPPPALYRLAERFGLSAYEQNLLLLCAAMELDPSIANQYAELQNNLPYPTFALAMILFPDPAWDALSPERALRYFRLIEVSQSGAQPLTASPLRADERIVSYLKGLNYLDDRLAPLFLPLEYAALAAGRLPHSQQWMADTIRTFVDQARQDVPGQVLVQLAGPDGLSKQMVAVQAGRSLAHPVHLLRLPVEWLPIQAGELELLARLWERERVLLGLGLYLDARESPDGPGSEVQAPPLQRFLGRVNGVVFLDTREVRSELGHSVLAVDIEKPSPAEQASAWIEALGEPASSWPGRLVGQFNLNLSTIGEIVRMAAAARQAHLAAHPGEASAEEDLGSYAWQICLVRTRPRLDQLAQRIEPKADWNDLELPKETKDLLQEICEQVEQRARVYDTWGLRAVMNRGLGISALFAGESGTGKTMAAEVMAKRLQLNLYRIDLSAVVSKYIGETEKNLRRLFDAAEDGGAILFFDEADSLFGKRSEVKDSHDRYANIEVNYLLQRMEAYRGLAILATNMKSALDQAFIRRLRFIVNFPFPGAEWRKKIWLGAFPSGVPLDVLDYDRLARFNLTGGSIHNAAVNAAFQAASRFAPVVTMENVLLAVRGELRKMEKPVIEKDFELKLSPAERKLLWIRAFSPVAPWRRTFGGIAPEVTLEGVDLERLAVYDLNSNSIYDIAAQAVLSALEYEPPVMDNAALLALVRDELKMSGKPVPEELSKKPEEPYPPEVL